MITAEEMAWCSLAKASGVGPRILWSIADYLAGEHKSAVWLLQHPDALQTVVRTRARSAGTTPITRSDEPDIRELERKNVAVLHPLHPEFPRQLRVLRDRFTLPALLYVQGNVELLSRPGVAIVGARHATEAAIAEAHQLATQLAAHRVNVISGYAKGVDTAAHIAALSGQGTTSVVLSEGINGFRVKRELRGLLTAENTVAVSQFEPGAPWTARSAMTRNRLVCALSRALVVILSGPERDSSGRMSGTFHAGETAMQMGIPVFAVASDFYPHSAEGNRQLIQRGCREWNPDDGVAPILAAIQIPSQDVTHSPDRTANKPDTGQLGLFAGGSV